MTKNTYNIVGVMSGTSLDGIDFCWVRFTKKAHWEFKILAAETVAYSTDMYAKLKTAITLSPDQLNHLNHEYTHYLGSRINAFIQKHQISNLDAVSSHGHTVFHQPEKGITLQIGNLPELTQQLQQTVVCDFRVQDVAMGGQGAPLVPIGDALLFAQYDFCLNLGGFANISFQHNNQRLAFDVCPANITLNHYAQTLGLPFDKGGALAKQGTLYLPLLEALNALDFYHKRPPKSLGLEWVQSTIYPLIASFDLDTNSVLRTLVEHTATQITNVLHHYNLSYGLFTGGGALNTFLMTRIEELLGSEIKNADSDLIHFKEALIFAFLGVLKLRNEVNCLQSVTGAKQDHSSGKIYFPSIV
jgi:anhydro-N-acetylmuramic acid kinase